MGPWVCVTAPGQTEAGRTGQDRDDSSEMALGHIPGGTTGLKEKEAHSPLSLPTSRSKCFVNANFLIQESKFSSNRSTAGLNAPPHAHTLNRIPSSSENKPAAAQCQALQQPSTSEP